MIKRLSVLLAIIFTMSMMSAMMFEAAQSDHDCIGEGCEICLTLEICDTLLKLGTITAAAALIIRVSAHFIKSCAGKAREFSSQTLISLRVRLDS